MNFKQYTIALLIMLFCAGSVIVGIRSALTSETSGYTSVPDKEQGFVEYQGSPYSTVYYSAPAQGSTVAVPMRSVNRGILRHSHASYHAGVQAVNSMSGTYVSRGLAQTSYQSVHSYGTFSAGNGGYGALGATSNYTVGSGSAGYVVGTGLHTEVSPVMGYTGGVASPAMTISGQNISAMPVYAQASALGDNAGPTKSGRRKVAPTEPGEDGQIYTDDDGVWYYDEEIGGWINLTTAEEGVTKIENGKVYWWNGSSWVFVADQADPNTPIGDTPWLFFGLLVAGYVGIITYRRNKPKPCDKQ